MRARAALMTALRIGVGSLLALLSVELVARSYAFMPEAGGVKIWNREGNAVSHWRRGVRLPISRGGKRVLVIGDSYTAAQHVNDDQTFSHLTERYLREAGLDVSLLNVGVPGSNLADHIYDGPKLAKKHGASWTLVALTDDDLGASAWAKAGTHFVHDGEGLSIRRPPEPRARAKDALKPIRNNSALIQNAFLQYKGLLEMAASWHPFRAQAPRPSRKPNVDYPVEEELLLADVAFEGAVTFVHLGVATPTPIEAEFRRVCSERRLHCVTTREELEALRRSGTPPQGFPNSGWDVGHLNAWGHQTVARALARGLAHAVF
ncbi:MAG: hypothetical protein ABUL60_26645 [Myxococcales bacterium]